MVLAVVSMVSMVGVAFVILATLMVFLAMVLSGFTFFVQFLLGMKHVVVRGITHMEDVDLTRPGHFKISLDQRHAKCVTECVGQADSFLAQRGSAEVAGKAFALALGRGGDGKHGTNDANDVVIIAVYVGVC